MSIFKSVISSLIIYTSSLLSGCTSDFPPPPTKPIFSDMFVPKGDLARKKLIGDKNNDGKISEKEAVFILNSTELKKKFLSMPLTEQKKYLLTFSKTLQKEIARLSASYGTWKWRFALNMAKEKGLKPSEAEAIALAWLTS